MNISRIAVLTLGLLAGASAGAENRASVPSPADGRVTFDYQIYFGGLNVIQAGVLDANGGDVGHHGEQVQILAAEVADVVGLVVARLVARQEDARELVERVLAVRRRVRAAEVGDLVLAVGLERRRTARDAALRQRDQRDHRAGADQAALELLERALVG